MEVLDSPLSLVPLSEGPEMPAAPPDLKKLDLTDVALAKFGDWRAEVAAVRANLKTLALDLSTQSKVDEAKSLRFRLIGQPRADARKVCKELKSKLTAVSRAVGEAEAEVVKAWDEAEALITPQIDQRQAELDHEREERARIERERVAALEAGVARLQGYADAAIGQPAEKIARGITALEAMTFPPERWQEFAARAAEACDQTLGKLRTLHAQAVELEQLRAQQQADEAAAAEIRRMAGETPAAAPAAPAPTAVPSVAAVVRRLVVSSPMVGTQASAPEAAPALEPVAPPAVVGTPASAPEAAAAALPQAAAPAAVDDAAKIKLGEVCDLFGFTMTREFVVGKLLIQPLPEPGRSVLFLRSQLPEFKAALKRHIDEVCP